MYSVYLVDDDLLILEEMTDIVPWMDNGFQVVGTQTRAELALREIERLAPDVVFCDLKMPGLSGNELMNRLQAAGAEAEFVMLSAYDEFAQVRAFFQQSGFDYLLKPVNPEDIQPVLERLYRKLSCKKGAGNAEVLTENPGFNNLLSYVNGHYTERITLDMLSGRFGFSRNYICGLFSRYLNTSLNSYLTKRRMEYAGGLLSDRTRMIKEVAAECGYSEYDHFFRVFKSYYGVSPREYQNGQG